MLRRVKCFGRTGATAALAGVLALAFGAAPATAATLTEQEKSDLAAVLKEAPAGIPTTLDLSNPVHYRFFIQQLNSAGFSPKRYPHLFETVEAARTVPPGAEERRSIAALAAAAPADSAVEPIQTLTAVGTNDGRNYAAAALSSVPDTPYFSSLVVGVYDAQLNPLGNPARVTSATAPATNLNAVATGVSPTVYGPVTGVASYFWQDQFGRAHVGTLTGAVSNAPTNITNTAPMPGSGQTITKLCLGRTGSDCTYTPAGGSGSNVRMPVAGNITFGQPISKDPLTQTSLITMAKPDVGQGGGCTIASTTDFFKDPGTVINGNRITWNLQPAQFQPANGCLTPNATAIYTFTLGLTVGPLPTFVTITSDPHTDPVNPYYKKIPELQVFFSCVAEGTDIQLPNGATAKIEALGEGTEVLVDAHGTAEKVDSKLKGHEEVPMVRLLTNSGHSLLITDGHPVMTPKGPVLAGSLKPRDEVITLNGTEALSAVTREKSDRPVWNLNVGTPPASLNDLSVKGKTYFAGGILVGDNVMQFVENRTHQKEAAAIALAHAPAEWRRDIESAIEDERK